MNVRQYLKPAAKLIFWVALSFLGSGGAGVKAAAAAMAVKEVLEKHNDVPNPS